MKIVQFNFLFFYIKDWRNLFGPVRNQGNCRNCWAFATVVVIEGMVAKTVDNVDRIDDVELVDCDRETWCCDKFFNKGCNGGSPYYALNYAQKYGLVTEESYTYKAKNDTCKNILTIES